MVGERSGVVSAAQHHDPAGADEAAATHEGKA
jgi:hypothetical protein